MFQDNIESFILHLRVMAFVVEGHLKSSLFAGVTLVVRLVKYLRVICVVQSTSDQNFFQHQSRIAFGDILFEGMECIHRIFAY